MSETPSPEVEQFVEHQLATGRYESADELADLVRDAARSVVERNRQLKEIRAELQPALERLDRGEGQEADFEQIKRQGRERLHEQASDD